MLKEEFLPVAFDSDLVQIIEAGTGEGFGKVVESYHLQWWTEATEPGQAWLLTKENIFDCIEHYEKQLKAERRKELSLHIVRNPQVPQRNDRKSSSGTPGGATGSSIGTASNNIMELIAMHSTNQLKVLLNSVNAQRQASEAKVQLAARRTATLYMLLETIMHKETADTTPPGPILKGQKSSVALAVAQKSKHLFLAGKDAIPVSPQWAFGAVLTKKEVSGLVHKSGRKLHTGYNTSHDWESLSGEETAWGIAEDIEKNISNWNNQECADDACRPLPDNSVAARSSKFHPQRPHLVLPEDMNTRMEYLKQHPEEEEEINRQWSQKNAQWDHNGSYIGITTASCERGTFSLALRDIGPGNSDISLAALNSPNVSGGLAALFDTCDITMSSPSENEIADVSMADFFSNSGSSTGKDNPDPTSLASLFDSDSHSEGGSLDPASLADLFDSDASRVEDNQGGASSGASSSSRSQISSNRGGARAAHSHMFTAADFLYVTEDVFEEENLVPCGNDSDIDSS